MVSNNYFRLRQFTIIQERSAMKVGTDSILLGAWAEPGTAKNILDIGSGTGILSLMMAQRTNAQITGIEIERKACEEAQYNISQSKWASQVSVINQPFQEFVSKCSQVFDFIITNPPFFKNALPASTKQRAKARYQASLPFDDIARRSKKLMSPHGKLALILPVAEGEQFIELALKQGLHLIRLTKVKPNPIKPPHRYLMEFSITKYPLKETQLTIEYKDHHKYTSEFKELTKGFYLNF